MVMPNRSIVRHARVLGGAMMIAGATTAWCLQQLDRPRADASIVDDVCVLTRVESCTAPAEAPDIPTAELPHKGASPDATKVTMLVCSDFDCPYCRKAAQTVDALLGRNEDLSFHYLHTPLRSHPYAMLKARAGVAAHQQGAFWPMHDALHGTRVESEEAAIELAARLGLDAPRFAEALRDPSADAEVERQRQACVEAGVWAVPTFFINGRNVRGALPIDQLQDIIDDERSRR